MDRADGVLFLHYVNSKKEAPNGLDQSFRYNSFPRSADLKTYSYPEFRKKVISIFKKPRFDPCQHQGVDSAQQNPDESVLEYMGRVQDNVGKAFPKPADANRQD